LQVPVPFTALATICRLDECDTFILYPYRDLGLARGTAGASSTPNIFTLF
jgi:hypothetical protein